MMPSVGAQLTQARTERRLSLQEATKATKIQVWVLEALERDELHATMSPVYVKGFLSTYAKFLGLEPAPLIAQLLPAPTGSGQPTPEASPHSTPLGFIDRFEWGGPWARRIGSLGLGLAGLLVVMNTHPQRWGPAPTGSGHQEASLSVIHKQEPLAPQPSIALKPLQPLELAIVARQPTWISVKADGTLVAQQKLAAGAQEAWKADRRFDVVIGAPAKVEVLLNGRSISPLAMAHRGRLAITHSGIAALKEEAPAPRPARVGSAR